MTTDPQAADEQPDPAGPPSTVHDPYGALCERDFCLFLGGNFLWIVGFKMQAVAVGYEIYHRTDSQLALGLVGLVQIVPVLALALIAGHVADRFDRRNIIMVSLVVTALATIGLAIVADDELPVWVTYALVAVTGVARGFSQPARSSFLPQIVSRDRFPNAITWSTGAFQLAFVAGPALAGLLIAAFAPTASNSVAESGPAIATSVAHAAAASEAPADRDWGGTMPVYLCHTAAAAVFFGLLMMIPRRGVPSTSEGMTIESLAAGARFVWSQKVMLGVLTLDLFAVLLGGATALLPVFASDEILDVGPTGLGWMETAPALGAVAMTLVMAHRRPMERAGRAMLLSVAGFGVATIVFGFSRWFPLSLVMLLALGALDNISVVIRHTLVQMLTPDAMRGRVTAINGMFIGASNELGAFESGLVAWWATKLYLHAADTKTESLEQAAKAAHAFGATFSVVAGGIGTIVVVTLLFAFAPALRRYGRLLQHGAN